MPANEGIPVTRVLITGANSGIGRDTALHLAGEGCRVWAGVRSPEKASGLEEAARKAGLSVEVVSMDVDDEASVRAAVAAVLEASGGIDVLINNAGIGGSGVVEDIRIDQAKGVFETNFWGVIRCTQAVLPVLRSQGHGHIINISSLLGRVAGLGQVVYSASKWSLECLSESLAQEVAGFGIRVSMIEAGSIRTNIVSNTIPRVGETEVSLDPAYAELRRRTGRFYDHGWQEASPAREVSKTVLEAIRDPSPRLRYICGWGAERLIAARARMSDEEWLELGRADSDEVYFERFRSLFDIDISSPVKYSSNRGLKGRWRRLKQRFRKA